MPRHIAKALMPSSTPLEAHVTRLIELLCCSLLLGGQIIGQGPKPVVRKPEAKPGIISAPPAGTHEMTAEDIGAFLDGLMPQQLAREDIAGAVVSVVKNGKVLFAKGYGYSDVEKKTAVTADNTL